MTKIANSSGITSRLGSIFLLGHPFLYSGSQAHLYFGSSIYNVPLHNGGEHHETTLSLHEDIAGDGVCGQPAHLSPFTMCSAGERRGTRPCTGRQAELYLIDEGGTSTMAWDKQLR